MKHAVILVSPAAYEWHLARPELLPRVLKRLLKQVTGEEYHWAVTSGAADVFSDELKVELFFPVPLISAHQVLVWACATSPLTHLKDLSRLNEGHQTDENLEREW